MRKLLVLLAACGPKAGPTVHNERSSATMTIAERGVGVIDANTHVTLTSMRGLFPGYEVTPEASMSNTTYNVTKNGEKILYVIANDDGSVFSVHVTSGAITDPVHNWRVGGKMPAGGIDACECDGEAGNEVAICFKDGEHVAAVFARPCMGMFGTEEDRKVLVGATITRLAWQAAPWTLGMNGMGM